MRPLYRKFEPGTYHTRELYRIVCETGDLRPVWAHKNSAKWGATYESFLPLCGEKCACCGSRLDYGIGKNNVDKSNENTPSTDHIVPRSLGGTDDLDNLWIICMRCNLLKNDSTPDDIHRYERIVRVHKAILEAQEKGEKVTNRMLTESS